jgi:hypothetical protein
VNYLSAQTVAIDTCKDGNYMKQSISECLFTTKRERRTQNSPSGLNMTGPYPEAEPLSDESKLLLLTHLYLDLRLTLEHALRAAQADIMATKRQSHRLLVEQQR